MQETLPEYFSSSLKKRNDQNKLIRKEHHLKVRYSIRTQLIHNDIYPPNTHTPSPSLFILPKLNAARASPENVWNKWITVGG